LTANINLKIASQRVRLAASLDAVGPRAARKQKAAKRRSPTCEHPFAASYKLSLRAAQDD